MPLGWGLAWSCQYGPVSMNMLHVPLGTSGKLTLSDKELEQIYAALAERLLQAEDGSAADSGADNLPCVL